MHVQGLFKDAPDLLSEFKDFLPEIDRNAVPSGVVGILPQPSGASGAAGPSWGQSDNAVSGGIEPAEKVNKKPIPSLKRRKRVVEKDVTPVPPAKGSTNKVRSTSSFPPYAHDTSALFSEQKGKTSSQGRLADFFAIPNAPFTPDRTPTPTQGWARRPTVVVLKSDCRPVSWTYHDYPRRAVILRPCKESS